MQRQSDWQSRMMLECMTAEVWPIYFTLTYSNDNLPPSEEECWKRTQRLPRKLRKQGYKVRYVINVERGLKGSKRLHHHGVMWITPQPSSDLAAQQLIQKNWEEGFVCKKTGFVRRKGAIKYVAKYIAKGSRFTYSLKPVIGAERLRMWESYVSRTHVREPYQSMAMVPTYISGPVLGKVETVLVPRPWFLRTCRELGVPYAPDTPREQYWRTVLGAPAGPLNPESLKLGIRHTYGTPAQS